MRVKVWARSRLGARCGSVTRPAVRLTDLSKTTNAQISVVRGLFGRFKVEDIRAPADFNSALHLDPTPGRAFVSRSDLRLSQSDKQQALADLRGSRSSRRPSHDADVQHNRGVVLRKLGKHNETKAALNEAIRLRPGESQS